MDNFKTIIRHAGTGLLISALMSMLTMIFVSQSVITVSRFQLTAMLVMSALIGLLSFIFDIEKLPFYGAIPLHFVLTAIIVFGTNHLLHGLFGVPSHLGIIYIAIYIGVWFLLKIWWSLDVHRINTQIKKRNQNH